MVAEKVQCFGQESSNMGIRNSVEACGSICQGVASMFIFGTKDFGVGYSCNSEGCLCRCETSATDIGTCDMHENIGYRLYKYVSGDYLTLYNRNVSYTSKIAFITCFIHA